MIVPPSPNATLDTMLMFGNLTEPVPIAKVMSLVDGELRYSYD